MTKSHSYSGHPAHPTPPLTSQNWHHHQHNHQSTHMAHSHSVPHSGANSPPTVSSGPSSPASHLEQLELDQRQYEQQLEGKEDEDDQQFAYFKHLHQHDNVEALERQQPTYAVPPLPAPKSARYLGKSRPTLSSIHTNPSSTFYSPNPSFHPASSSSDAHPSAYPPASPLSSQLYPSSPLHRQQAPPSNRQLPSKIYAPPYAPRIRSVSAKASYLPSPASHSPFDADQQPPHLRAVSGSSFYSNATFYASTRQRQHDRSSSTHLMPTPMSTYEPHHDESASYNEHAHAHAHSEPNSPPAYHHRGEGGYHPSQISHSHSAYSSPAHHHHQPSHPPYPSFPSHSNIQQYSHSHSPPTTSRPSSSSGGTSNGGHSTGRPRSHYSSHSQHGPNPILSIVAPEPSPAYFRTSFDDDHADLASGEDEERERERERARREREEEEELVGLGIGGLRKWNAEDRVRKEEEEECRLMSSTGDRRDSVIA
jgi:hypothetical protein